MKGGKIYLLVLLALVLLVVVVILSPLICLVLICYIIFALPREMRLEHERKMYRLKNGLNVVNKQKSSINGLLAKFQKLGEF